MHRENQPQDSFISRRLDERYLIDDYIDKGGMGRVYLATDEFKGDQVAIKYVPFGRGASRDELLFEGRILIKLDNPNLPKVRDLFRDDQGHYLVMEYIPGETLEQLIKRRGRLPPEEAAEYVKSVLNVLHYLHKRNPPIIHRDIKPANLKFHGDGRLMLVDFGIAKEYELAKKTRLGALKALTRGYAPAEQYEGKGITDPRTDLFALGGVFYYLLTAEHPYEVERHNSITYYHVDPREKNPNVPEALSEIVTRATALKMKHRYSSAKEMYRALDHALRFSTQKQPIAIGPVLEDINPRLPTTTTNQNNTHYQNNRNILLTFLLALLLATGISAIAYFLFIAP